MKCIKCESHIDVGDSYVSWGGFEYCGTSCVVDQLVDDDGLEERVREGIKGDNIGTHFH